MAVEFRVQRVARRVVLACPPSIERGLLVVDEQAAELDRRLSMHGRLGQGKDLGMLLGGDVGEPVIAALYQSI